VGTKEYVQKIISLIILMIGIW